MQLHKVVPVGSWKHNKGLELPSTFHGYFRYLNALSQFATSSVLIGPLACRTVGRCTRIQSYMSNGDWLNTSCNLLIGYWGVSMWRNDVDWLTSGEVDVISAWSEHVHYVEARWEVTCEELMLFMPLEAKYTRSSSLTPHNRNYIHSTCYNFIKSYCQIYWYKL